MTELTTPEIRKLIKAHNILVSIKIPAKATRQQIISLIEKKGYVIDHVGKKLKPKSRPRLKAISLDDADKTLKKPEKTALQKQKADETKQRKFAEKEKELKLAKKQAVKEFKEKKAAAEKAKPKAKPKPKPAQKKPPMKKEDEVRKARKPYPTIPPNVKGKRIPKGQLLLQDKKEGQVVKKPVKQSMKDKLIQKDKKEVKQQKKEGQQRKDDKTPYKPVADSSMKDQIFKLEKYFTVDGNKVGKTFKTVKEVNDAIGKLFSSVKDGDAVGSLGSSERKYFTKLLASMLRNSSLQDDGVEVPLTSLKKYRPWFNAKASAEGKQKQRNVAKAQKKEKAQLEDKPAIRAREVAEAKKKESDRVKRNELAKEKRKESKKEKKDTTEDKPTPITLPYEEESSHSDALKKAMKSLYDVFNRAVDAAKKLPAKDLVETAQLSAFRKIYFQQYEDILDSLEDNEKDYDLLTEEWDEKLDGELDNILDGILKDNRKKTDWKPAKPDLKKLQDKYIRLMKQYEDGGKEGGIQSSTFQAAESVKKQIKKHYKAEDVPNLDKEEKKEEKKPVETETKVKLDFRSKKITRSSVAESDIIAQLKRVYPDYDFPDTIRARGMVGERSVKGDGKPEISILEMKGKKDGILKVQWGIVGSPTYGLVKQFKKKA